MRRSNDRHAARTAWFVVAGLVVFMLVLAGCGGGSSSSGGSSSEGGEGLQKLGKGEGELNLISWAGYVEEEWVKPFEQETGCKVNDKVAGTSDEMVKLMETGQYDGVSASGNATARLWAAHEVAPVNVSLVPNYKTVFADLKNQVYNTFEGQPYGIPHGRGANLLNIDGGADAAAGAAQGRDEPGAHGVRGPRAARVCRRRAEESPRAFPARPIPV